MRKENIRHIAAEACGRNDAAMRKLAKDEREESTTCERLLAQGVGVVPDAR